MVDQTIDQEVEEAAKTPEELVPDLAIIDPFMMGEGDLLPNERLMHPGDRHRAIVSYHLDELTNEAAWNFDDEITVGSGSNRPLAIMSTVDLALVRRMDLAIVLNDEVALDILFGAAPDKIENNESDISLMANNKVRNSVHNLTENDIVFDTGATKHSMKCMNGAIRTRSASGQKVVAFDGRAMTINCCFDFRGDVLDG